MLVKTLAGKRASLVRRVATALTFSAGALLFNVPSSEAIDIVLNFNSGASESPSFDPVGGGGVPPAGLLSLFQYAESVYEDIFEDTAPNTTLTINYWYEDLSGLAGQNAAVAQSNDGGAEPWRSIEANIRIDTLIDDGSGTERD